MEMVVLIHHDVLVKYLEVKFHLKHWFCIDEPPTTTCTNFLAFIFFWGGRSLLCRGFSVPRNLFVTMKSILMADG
jgi:hypothetical protein